MVRVIGKCRLKVLLMTNLLILLKVMNVALARCNLKWSPLVGMLVQGLVEALMMIMIGMNLICVLKDCVKRNNVVCK